MVIFNIVFAIILWNMLMVHINYKYKHKQNRLYCGIIGFSGKTKFDLQKIETLIAWNSFERGSDATGIYSPINGLKKSLEKGSDYVIYETKNYFQPDNLFIGHVRQATVGDKKEIKNAHPFQRGNYVLAHNGTLKNYRDLAHKYELPLADYNVDSDYVAGSIEKADSIEQVLSEINGAAAFIITDDRNPDKLYVFRNTERPLYRGYDRDKNMYISSLAEPLYLLRLENIKEFKENFLYTIIDGNIKANTVKKIKNTPYSKPVTTYPNKQWQRHADEEYIGMGCGFNLARHMRPNKQLSLLPTPPSLDNVKPVKIGNTLDLWDQVWVRAKVSISYYESEHDARVELISGERYLSSTSSNDPKKTWVQLGDKFIEVSKRYFEVDDLIEIKDLVMILEEKLVSKNGAFVGNKGDIHEVLSMYPDADIVTVQYGKEVKHTTRYTEKHNFRKLTEEERDEFISIRDHEASNSNNFAVEAVVDNTQALNRSNEIMVNEEKLKLYFDTMDNELESLRELAKNSYIKLDAYTALIERLAGLIDYQFVQRDKLIDEKSIKT